MPKFRHYLLIWMLVMPVITTLGIVGLDYLRGTYTAWSDYLGHTLGFSAGGFFGAWVSYHAQKLNVEDK